MPSSPRSGPVLLMGPWWLIGAVRSHSLWLASIPGISKGGEGGGRRGQPSAGPWRRPGWAACPHLQPDSIPQPRPPGATPGWSALTPSLRLASQVGAHDSGFPHQCLDLPRGYPVGKGNTGEPWVQGWGGGRGAEGVGKRGAHRRGV